MYLSINLICNLRFYIMSTCGSFLHICTLGSDVTRKRGHASDEVTPEKKSKVIAE